MLIAFQWLMTGRVQGVGFRPYIYRLATQHHLVGWVKNLAGQVEIRVQGAPSEIQAFADDVIVKAPPLAQPQILSCIPCDLKPLTTFTIQTSEPTAVADIHVPPDYFTCDDCLTELHNPLDRRYRYPFINCTQCGPRYTLIYRLPYDRPYTSMAQFPLCPECAIEYQNPADRRFHAQPLACPICGPQLSFHAGDVHLYDTQSALTACVQAIQAGKIVAIKGIGGYHLVCAAMNDEAIIRLRQRKPRPAKPLAVMFPFVGTLGLDCIQTHLALTPLEVTMLLDPSRPIVLVRQRSNTGLSAQIAPHLTEIGAMLPYSPLHHLLLAELNTPIIATSANLSGEPVLTDNASIETRLAHIAEAFLHHNRPIVRPADDSVCKIIAQKPRFIRLGRGIAPLEIPLPFSLPQPVLAVGGHLKNTVALAIENRAIISPHIGDLDAPRSLDVFTQVIQDLQKLYDIQACSVICDAHPLYASSRWARRSGLPVIEVFHHHAHASAVAGEFPSTTPWLVFTWDGVGLGADGTLWGGEALYGQPAQWERVASWRPFFLPGGEKAGREPWRSAAAICWETATPYFSREIDSALLTLLYQAWQKRLNCPQTTAIGRLFDAAASLMGILHVANFEGQAPMLLETVATASSVFTELPLIRCNGWWQTDWSPLLGNLMDTTLTTGERAARFHNSLAHALLAQARQIRMEREIGQIGLSGGVFQNRRLTEQVITLLQSEGFIVYLPERVPCNDAGLSFGQIVEGIEMNPN